MQSRNDQNFGMGMLVGAAIGGLAAYFLSPKSGPENRDEVSKKMREWWERASSESQALYKRARVDLDKRMGEVREKLNKSDYMRMVDRVMAEIKIGMKGTQTEWQEVRDRLADDWKEIKEDKDSEKDADMM